MHHNPWKPILFRNSLYVFELFHNQNIKCDQNWFHIPFLCQYSDRNLSWEHIIHPNTEVGQCSEVFGCVLVRAFKTNWWWLILILMLIISIFYLTKCPAVCSVLLNKPCFTSLKIVRPGHFPWKFKAVSFYLKSSVQKLTAEEISESKIYKFSGFGHQNHIFFNFTNHNGLLKGTTSTFNILPRTLAGVAAFTCISIITIIIFVAVIIITVRVISNRYFCDGNYWCWQKIVMMEGWVILILINFWILHWAYLQVVPFCSLIPKLFLFLLGICYIHLVSSAKLHYYSSFQGYLSCLCLWHMVQWPDGQKWP